MLNFNFVPRGFDSQSHMGPRLAWTSTSSGLDLNSWRHRLSQGPKNSVKLDKKNYLPSTHQFCFFSRFLFKGFFS